MKVKSDSDRQMDVFRTKNHVYSQKDEEYYDNLKKIRPKSTNIEEMIEFYRLWFDTYDKVVEEWDGVPGQE